VIRLEKYPGYLGDYHRIASLAMEVSANGGCICIILNTVKTAQQVYLALKEIKGADVDVVLFHSRFMASRRDEIEKKALELFDKRSLLSESDANHKARPERVILVATQVVEQSLDIDFDEMITELAPIDLILQRVGRLHRHNRKERPTGQIPKIHVLLPDKGKLDFGSSEKVYARYILIKTLDIVLQKQTIALPSDIRGLVEETYAAYAPGLKPSSCDITTDDLSDSYHEMLQILDSDRGKAAAYLIGNPSKKEYLLAPRSFSFDEDDEGARSYFNAKTRLGDDSIRVTVLNDGEFENVISLGATPPKEAIRRIMLRMVNIPYWWIRGCKAEHGYEQIQQGPKWLKGTSIMRMKSWKWKGVDSYGNHITIVNDDETGFRMDKTEKR
jgi:CRISPR-associated endonuclease/helicase Cas3